MPRNYKYYNPLKFNVNAYSPALWLDAADRSTLIMDGARTTDGISQYLSSSGSDFDLSYTGCMWWAGWMYFPAKTAGVFVQKTTGYPAGMIAQYEPGGTQFSWYWAAFQLLSAPINPAGTWMFVACGVDTTTGNKKMYLKINNATTVTRTHNVTMSNPAATFNVGGTNNYHAGRFDSVCCGKVATSGWLDSNFDNLASYLYNGGSGRRSSDFLTSGWYTGSNPSGAVSWWDMDARSGNESDRIGTNNLTDNGGVGYATGIASGLVQYNGDPITRWQDKSGNARHVTAGSDAVRPAYATGVQNGLSAILYDALDDKLDLASPLTLTDQTIFAVVKLASTITAATASKVLLGVVSGDACGIAYGTGTGTLTNERLWWYRVYLANVYGKGQCAADIPAGGYVHSFSYTNATPLAEIWQNGVAQTLVATSAGEANSTRPYTGYQRIGSAFGDHICELLVFPSVLSISQRQQVERYLGSKWGVAVA